VVVSKFRGDSVHDSQINEIRPLTPADIGWAAAVVTRSFFRDPGMIWVLPDDDLRHRLGVEMASAFIRYGSLEGHVEVDARGRGIAIWFPPGTEPPQEPVLRQTGMWEVPRMIGDIAWSRIRSMMSDLEGLHRRRRAEPHWYLSLLGVDPDVQRHGIGTALLHRLLSRMDSESFPCYLLTQSADNVRFYEGRGFRVVAGADAAQGRLHLRLMRRSANGG